jgi:hypothetical protein
VPSAQGIGIKAFLIQGVNATLKFFVDFGAAVTAVPVARCGVVRGIEIAVPIVEPFGMRHIALFAVRILRSDNKSILVAVVCTLSAKHRTQLPYRTVAAICLCRSYGAVVLSRFRVATPSSQKMAGKIVCCETETALQKVNVQAFCLDGAHGNDNIN